MNERTDDYEQMKDALRLLEEREAGYRAIARDLGIDSGEARHALDLLRRAGTRARYLLNGITTRR